MNKMDRSALRKEKIRARENLSPSEIKEKSLQIVERILSTSEFRSAEKILIYRGIRGEVRLEALTMADEAKGKQFLFPLCLDNHEMAALCPLGNDAWRPGSYGILEPVWEKSEIVEPESIDLIICPCTVFDDACNRMGMGGGYYDRYLPKCKNAVIAAAAFEVQKTTCVPMEEWDRPMRFIFTEKKTYRKK